MISEVHFCTENRNGWIRRSVILTHPEHERQELWMEVPEVYAQWLTNGEEPLLLLALFFIMKRAGSCRVHADVDRTLLENLTEYMRIWQFWCPGEFFCPELIPDNIIDRQASACRSEAICAFSGGVDASYALMSHHAGLWGKLSLRVPAAVMVHGADIFLSQQTEFDYAYTCAQASLDEYGIVLIPLRTNHREYSSNWEFSHYSVVVAALSLFGKRFCRGLIGSDNIASKEQIAFHIPYGMNYVTDHLLNAADFSCTIVGSDVTRSERCAYIAHFAPIMKNLRVCWQYDAAGRNCGICEKCQRTALNFMAAGYKGALPFTEPFSLQRFKETAFRDNLKLSALAEICNYNQHTSAIPPEVITAIKEKLCEAETDEKRMNQLIDIPTTLSPFSLRIRILSYKVMSLITRGKRRTKYKKMRRECKNLYTQCVSPSARRKVDKGSIHQSFPERLRLFLIAKLPLFVSRPLLMRREVRCYIRSHQQEIDKLFETYLTPQQRSNCKLLRWIRIDIARCWILYKSYPVDYFLWDFLNTPHRKRKTFLTNELRETYTHSGNAWKKLRDKYLCYTIAKKFYKRAAVPVRSADDKVSFLELAARNSLLFAKPINLWCGEGARILDTRTDEKAQEAFLGLLAENNDWIVEESIVQSNELAVWNPDSVNTVRIPSFLIGNRIVIIKPIIRFGRKGAIIDNTSAGGYFACIDSKTGIIVTDALSYKSGIEYHAAHPDSGKVFKGYQIPEWDSLIQLTEEVHHLFPDIRYIAFDFAHTDKGWVLVEANGNGEATSQYLDKVGIKEVFLELMNHP